MESHQSQEQKCMKGTHLGKAMAGIPALLSLLSLLSSATGVRSATLTLTNNCGYTVWPGVLANAGSAPLATIGFALGPGETMSLGAPAPWSGRFWGRTLCSADAGSGRFSCGTGDCGSGAVECSGGGAAPPATLAEFTLDGSGGLDFYDVSLVDGYNLPLIVAPQGGEGGCGTTGCTADLNGACPPELRVAAPGGGAAACRSACGAFGSPEYCCSGAYGSPGACRPTAYSQLFKNACPRAYSYAYDDATSTFTCASATYVITFCPSTTSLKSSGVHPQAAAGLPLSNDTMVFMGGDEMNRAVPRSCPIPVSAISLVVLGLSCLLSPRLH